MNAFIFARQFEIRGCMQGSELPQSQKQACELQQDETTVHTQTVSHRETRTPQRTGLRGAVPKRRSPEARAAARGCTDSEARRRHEGINASGRSASKTELFTTGHAALIQSRSGRLTRAPCPSFRLGRASHRGTCTSRQRVTLRSAVTLACSPSSLCAASSPPLSSSPLCSSSEPDSSCSDSDSTPC